MMMMTMTMTMAMMVMMMMDDDDDDYYYYHSIASRIPPGQGPKDLARNTIKRTTE